MECKIKKYSEGKGSGLIEVVLAIALFVILVPALVMLALGSISGVARSQERLEAAALAQEALEAARAIRDFNWDNLIVGAHGLTDTNNYWEFSGTSDLIGKYSRSIIVAEENSYAKNIEVNVNWTSASGIAQTLSVQNKLTNWNILRWIQSSLSDFANGTMNSAFISGDSDGLQLTSIGSWQNATVLTSYDFSGDADVKDIFIKDNTLYLVTKNQGSGMEFMAVDLTDVSANGLVLLNGTELGVNANKLAVQNGYAFITTDSPAEEVVVVRLEDFEKVNNINVPANIGRSIYIQGNIMYIGTSKDSSKKEFYAYDISNPEGSLPLLGSVEIGEQVNGIYVQDGYAYIATDDDAKEIIIIRLADYAVVNHVNLENGADAEAIYGSNGKLYVGRHKNSASELYIFNILAPGSSLQNDGEINLGAETSIRDIYVYGSRAYVATSAEDDEETAVIDLNGLQVESWINLLGGGETDAIALYGAYLYVGSRENGKTLQVVRAQEGGWSAPKLSGNYDLPSGYDASDIFVKGDFAYVSTKNNSEGNEFYIFNVASPDSIGLASSFEIGDDVNDIYVSGNYAYLATSKENKELIILNVADKKNLSEAGNYDSNGSPNGLSIIVNGGTAYLGTENNGSAGAKELYILDVDVPQSASLQSSYEVGGAVQDIKINGNFAYIAENNPSRELEIINISSPTAPVGAAVFDVPNSNAPNRLAFSNNSVFLTTMDGSNNPDFYIINVGDLEAISVTSSLDLGRSNNDISLDATNKIAFLGTDESGQEVTLIDYSNQSSPKTKSYFNALGAVKSIFVENGNAYLASTNDAKEFQIISPTLTGIDFVADGIYVSPEFDTGSATTSFGQLSWNSEGTGTITFQLRTADAEANLNSAVWAGPDGDDASYYTFQDLPIVLSPSATGTRWLQYRAIFNGDGESTPILKSVSITYEH